LRPTVVDGGRSALAAMEQAQDAGERFPLVLLDGHMPEMDGFTLAERINQRPEFAGTTILLLSSAGQKDDIARCRAVGISACLTKPVKQSELFDAILKALSKWNEEDTARTTDRSIDEAQWSTSSEASTDGDKNLRILLAEDNAINQKLAIALLKKKDWQGVAVSNGEEALQAIASEPFDLILMDVQMPEMGGFEVTKAIREKENGTGRYIPIVAMTAHAMTGDKEKCLEAGMDAYVSKPIHAEALYATIERMMNGKPEPTPEPPADPNLPQVGNLREVVPINLSTLIDVVDGDQELLKELAAGFVEDSARQLEELLKSLENGDPEQIEQRAHRLKGAVGNFGAKAAYDLAYELENRGRESRLDGAVEVYRKLKNEMEQVKAFFSETGWRNKEQGTGRRLLRFGEVGKGIAHCSLLIAH